MPGTEDDILSRKLGNWKDFFKLLKSGVVPKDFMSERDNEPLEDRALGCITNRI